MGLKEYVKKFKKQFILGPAFKLSEAILELFIPLIMAKIVDVGIANGNIPYIVKMGGLMMLLGMVGFIFAVICQYSAASAQQGIGTLLRRDLFHKIHTLSKKQQDAFSDSTLTTRILNDVNQVQTATAMFIRLAFRWPFIILGSLLAAMVLDLKLSIIFLVAAVALSVLLYVVLSRSHPLYRKIQKKTDTLSAITEDSLSGVRVIRAFQKIGFHKKQFGSVNDDITRINLRVAKLNACLNPLSFALLNLCIVLLLLLGGKRIQIGTLTQGQMIAFTNYMSQILMSIMIFANTIVLFTKASASVERIEEVLNQEPDMVEGGIDTVSTETTEIAAAFHNVSFSYADSAEAVLSHISLEIPKGATVGIVGGTGAGKSTLMKVLCRLYDTDAGTVELFGKDVKAYTNKALHSAVHLVSQGNPLFKGTVRENLVCGKKDIPDETIKEALEMADAAGFVFDLEQGLDAPVLEGGKNFSGGQKQRLTIARALLGDPKILIFDDSLSALDFATEAKIRKNLANFKGDKTIIFISQRIHVIKNADMIFVLEDGTLAGQGTHRELLKSNELYREICRSQNVEEGSACVQ